MQDTTRSPHPVVFSILMAPFGVVGGYVGVALVFLATRYGLSVEDGALLIAAGMFPHVWKFFWSPITDTLLTRKTWYRMSVVLAAVGTVGMASIPLSKQNFYPLVAIIFLTSLSTTFLGMALEGLMAHSTPPEQRGRVGGWFQAGNLGGNGLGGGAGLWMLTHLPYPWISGVVLAASFLAGLLVLHFVPEAPPENRDKPLLATMGGILRELWDAIRSRRGLLCLALCVLPIGTGAATGVLGQAEVAAYWSVSEDTVALVNGALNGGISALGCLAGGTLCLRYSSRRVYAAVGLLMAAVALGMAVTPFVPASFVAYNLAYAFVTGLAYAAFTGFVLDAIGKGAAATKYNAFASISNAPITYMGLVLAAVEVRAGPQWMLTAEAAAGVLGLIVVGILASLLPRRQAEPA